MNSDQNVEQHTVPDDRDAKSYIIEIMGGEFETLQWEFRADVLLSLEGKHFLFGRVRREGRVAEFRPQTPPPSMEELRGMRNG